MSEALIRAERAKLKTYLIEFFNRDELEDIVFDLSISLGSFGEGITKSKFVRELIKYCERRKLVDCLLLEITRRRDQAHEILGELLAKFGACLPGKKVQIILRAEELTIPLEQLRKMIADVCPNVSKEEIVIIAAATGSVRLLLGLSEQGAIELLAARSQMQDILPINSIESFTDLGMENQKTWRSLAKTYPAPNYGTLRLIANWQEIVADSQNETRQQVTILIAENNLLLLRSSQEYLENSDFIVYTAETPEQAQRKLESDLKIDVAVIGIRLRDDGDERDISGLEIARLRPDIPKIIWTAYPDYRTTRIALKHSLPIAQEYLAKKEGLPKLMSTINWVLDKASFFNIEQSNISRTKLASTMQQSFNQGEFETLVFHLQEEMRQSQIVGNLENVVEQAHSLNNKIEAAIKFLAHRGQLVLLLHLCRKFRPYVDWQGVVSH